MIQHYTILYYKESKAGIVVTGADMDALVSSPGEMIESSGKRGLVTFPSSAAVDSNTGVSPSSSETSPQGEAKYNAILVMRNGKL